MEEEQAALKNYGELFKVCKNRPENDAHWDSEARVEIRTTGGGFCQIFLEFSPRSLGKMNLILTSIFFKGVETTN